MRGKNEGRSVPNGQIQHSAPVSTSHDVIVLSEQRPHREEDVMGNRTHRTRARSEDDNVVDLTGEPEFEVVSSTVVPRPLRTVKRVKKQYAPILQHMMPAPPPTVQEEPKKSAPVCGICMEPMGPNTQKPMAAGNCGHVYCKPCLMMSVKKYRKCPTCRKNVQSRQIRNIFLDLQ